MEPLVSAKFFGNHTHKCPLSELKAGNIHTHHSYIQMKSGSWASSSSLHISTRSKSYASHCSKDADMHANALTK
jgi:hypothetical protein